MAKQVKYVLPYPPMISTRDSAEEAQRKLAEWQKANIKNTYNPRFHDGPPPPDFVDSPLWRVEYEPIKTGTVDHPPPQVIPAAPDPPAPELLSEREEEVDQLIRNEGPLPGKAICKRLVIGEKVLANHIIPALKRKRGLQNKRTRGYFYPT
jgi:hypothetical protein